MTSNRLPDGVVDLLPGRARALAQAQAHLARAFERAGYARLYTPLFELLEVLEAGLGAEERRALFRLVDPAGGEVAVLRPDFTAQVARVATSKLAALPRPLRLSYEGRIARARDPLGRGLRRRDVFQSGVELIGAPGVDAEVEVILAGVRGVATLGLPLTLDLGHAQLLPALLPPEAPMEAVQAALARKDAAALDRLAPGLGPLARLYGPRPVLDEARRTFASAAPEAHAALDHLAEVAERLAHAAPEVTVLLDLGTRRQHGYYTGLFFAGYVPNAADAVLTGGRYDDLLGRFGAQEPAVGLGVDLLRLVEAQPGEAAPFGAILATQEPGSARVLAALEALRDAHGRAVAVPPDAAEVYRAAHGYAVVVEDGPDVF